MKPTVAFFSAVHYKDYDFLLGSIEHHAGMGFHLVLDTSPLEHALSFSGLPETVRWVHEPLYGSGWKEFRMKSAVARALQLAREFRADVVASLDADEFYSEESVEGLFPYAARYPVAVHCTHWLQDGHPYMFGESEWHLRAWPSELGVTIERNIDWQHHPAYNGNPEHHPVPVAPVPEIRVPGSFHHHVHYAFPGASEETAEATIDGWPEKGHRTPKAPWPALLRMWATAGNRPSERFPSSEVGK